MTYQLLKVLEQPAYLAAPRLLGSYLHRTIDGQDLIGKIVETEAYDQTDMASHSYKGRTERTDVMFGPAGHLYVYFTYGMHYCCNVVTGPKNHGAAVLIRALEPIDGEPVMAKHRSRSGLETTNGPAKLCQALKIDKTLNGHDLSQPPLRLELKKHLSPEQVVQTTRIGISQAIDVPWRFYIKNNRYISKM